AAGLAAFDGAQKNVDAVQGRGADRRLSSILNRLRRSWTMDLRIPLGAGLAALVILPMSVALLNQTALTPVRFETSVAEKADEAAPRPAESQDGNAALLNAPVPNPPIPASVPNAVAPQMEMLTRSVAPSVMPSPAFDMMSGGGDRFASFEEGGVLRVADAPVST